MGTRLPRRPRGTRGPITDDRDTGSSGGSKFDGESRPNFSGESDKNGTAAAAPRQKGQSISMQMTSKFGRVTQEMRAADLL